MRLATGWAAWRAMWGRESPTTLLVVAMRCRRLRSSAVVGKTAGGGGARSVVAGLRKGIACVRDVCAGVSCRRADPRGSERRRVRQELAAASRLGTAVTPRSARASNGASRGRSARARRCGVGAERPWVCAAVAVARMRRRRKRNIALAWRRRPRLDSCDVKGRRGRLRLLCWRILHRDHRDNGAHTLRRLYDRQHGGGKDPPRRSGFSLQERLVDAVASTITRSTILC